MRDDVPPRAAKQKRGNTIWLREPTYETVKARAARAGVSMSAFIENALLGLRTPFRRLRPLRCRWRRSATISRRSSMRSRV